MAISTPTSIPILGAHELIGARAGFALFEPVSFALHAGQLLWLEGDNGVGKTTLLRGLLGLSPLKFTGLNFQGQPLPAARALMQRQSRWLSHQSTLKSSLSVAQNWQFWAALYDAGPIDSVGLASSLGLDGLEAQPVVSLSAGQKKRAQLALLSFGNPALWLLDEPFANLDQSGIKLVERLICQHLDQGGAALSTSHGVLGTGSALAARASALKLRPAKLVQMDELADG
jgi:heme exporter protein A